MKNTAYFRLNKNIDSITANLAKRIKLNSNNTYKYIHQDEGFTLIEFLVVVVMVGVLATIAAPSWLSFVNRQRINKANDVILNSIQEAQRKAKENKRNYSVSFRVNNNNQMPEIALHPDSATPRWQPLGGDAGVEAKQILLGTNLAEVGSNNTKNSVANPNNPTVSFSLQNLTTQRKITFDYMGSLQDANFGVIPTGSTERTGLKIVVATPQGGNRTQPGSMKRCVILQTLIGSMRTAKDGECN